MQKNNNTTDNFKVKFKVHQKLTLELERNLFF